MRTSLARLPLAAALALGVMVVGGLFAGGFYAFRAYDYVEHDNAFCFSCHLMAEPYELFAQSAHRGLGCKACHQPSLLERSRMGFTGIVIDPDSVSAHAVVPNELCANCHIEGDPERWRVVASSAGHRIHLESEDPSLDGLQCVECHASSLHEFTAVDRTCAQSGCHVDSGIQLGAMSDLTIHCAACHGFSTPVESGVTASEVIAPNQDTCLGCHAMRVLADMPEPDPHEGACASCHNPHEQETPADAARSCSSAGCHQDVAALTSFHVGLDTAVVAECVSCHVAHDFSLDGNNCLACHQDILTPPSSGEGSALQGVRALTPGVGVLHFAGAPQERGFDHLRHAALSCASCHDTSQRHGETVVRTAADCRSCHHSNDDSVVGGCETCHTRAELGNVSHPVAQSLDLSVAEDPVARVLSFDHATHAAVTCASCHVESPEQSAAAVQCSSCHIEHHEPTTDCASCHEAAAGGAHRVETAHVTCSGAGCHLDAPFEGVPRTRPVCLACHQEQVDHRPEGDCADCHALPGGEEW